MPHLRWGMKIVQCLICFVFEHHIWEDGNCVWNACFSYWHRKILIILTGWWYIQLAQTLTVCYLVIFVQADEEIFIWSTINFNSCIMYSSSYSQDTRMHMFWNKLINNLLCKRRSVKSVSQVLSPTTMHKQVRQINNVVWLQCYVVLIKNSVALSYLPLCNVCGFHSSH